MVSVKSTVGCAGAGTVPFPFVWPFCNRFSASAIELAECLDFPFASGLAMDFFALLEIINRRRAGADFGLTPFPPVRRLLNAFDVVVVFRFNINNETQINRVGSEKSRRLCLLKAAALECSPVHSPVNLGNCEHRRLTRV